jgi:hypothetical protein
MAFDQTVKTLHDGKAALRRARQVAPLEEKILDLWRAQHIYVQIVETRRPLMSWERPWNIMNDVREAVVIKDGVVKPAERMPMFSASPSHWVRPPHRWVLLL